MNFWENFKQNIDTRIVVSTVVGAVVASGVGYAMTKTGIKPIEKVGKSLSSK